MYSLLHFPLRATMLAFFGFLLLIPLLGTASTTFLEKCAPETFLDGRNRDDVKPTFPLTEDLRRKPSNILKAHQILRNGLQEFLEFKDTDLETYLKHIIESDAIIFKDEFGVEIRAYYKVFQFIWMQYNESLCQNYAIKQYDMDKLDLCSVARFLSHQSTSVKDHKTIMKRMGDALQYKCHPCTPYKRKEYGETAVPNTDDISEIEGLSLEQIRFLCKDYDHFGKTVVVSSTAPPSTTSTFKTTPKTITTRATTTSTVTKAPRRATTPTAAIKTKAPTVVYARAVISGTSGVAGVLNFTESSDIPGVRITGQVFGLSPGKHGFHVHQFGDVFTEGCDSTGSHFNPKKASHGDQSMDVNYRHAGDLGNILADEIGVAKVNMFDLLVTLIPNFGEENTSILGRGVVIHEKEDDLGLRGNDNSKVDGNSGKYLACGIISLSVN